MASPEEKNAVDVEMQGDGRKGSRVGGALKGPTTLTDDESSVMSVGKQMELEAGNSIKYRSCSWQKVCSTVALIQILLKSPLDRGSVVQRVYLLGNHVIPLFVLCSWPCPWSHSYRCCRGYRSLYQFDNLAILSSPSGGSRCM